MIFEIARRSFAVIPVAIGIGIIAFFLIRLVPGDIVDVLLDQNSDPETAARLRQLFGLNRPIHEQFAEWVGRVLVGDLGTSIRTGRPVLDEIVDRLPTTVELTVAAVLLSVLIGLPSGVISATHRNRLPDVVSRLASLIGISIPNFWLGLLLVSLFAVHLRWLPSQGYAPVDAGFGRHLSFLILPAVTLAVAMAAVTARMMRATLLDVLGQDYVRTARSKGLREARVILGHALRNALIPVVTVLGIQTGRLLGGTVVVEQLFSWPGLGSLVVRGISQRDYALVQGSVMVLALLFVVVNLAVDICYVYLNPRLRR